MCPVSGIFAKSKSIWVFLISWKLISVLEAHPIWTKKGYPVSFRIDLSSLFLSDFCLSTRDTHEYYSVVMVRDYLVVHCSWWCKDGACLSCTVLHAFPGAELEEPSSDQYFTLPYIATHYRTPKNVSRDLYGNVCPCLNKNFNVFLTTCVVCYLLIRTCGFSDWIRAFFVWHFPSSSPSL
jgi:hypothetical protein